MIKIWSQRKLTLPGRIIIIKSLALSKFTHLFISLPNPPDELLKRLDKIFYKFLFNSGPDRISRNNMIRNEREGSLRMIKISTFIKALKVTWFCIYYLILKISSGVVYQILNLQNYFPLELGMHYT